MKPVAFAPFDSSIVGAFEVGSFFSSVVPVSANGPSARYQRLDSAHTGNLLLVVYLHT